MQQTEWRLFENIVICERKITMDNWKHRSSKMSCAACMWFVMKEKAESCKSTVPIGRCRRRSPTINGYPVVFGTDWCGDHKIDENSMQR